MELIENLIRENHLEKVLASNLPQKIKQDWHEFFEEYEQKKETAYIDSVEKLLALSKEEAEKVLYVKIKEVNQETIEALYACKAIKAIYLINEEENEKNLHFDIGKFTELRVAIISLNKVTLKDRFEQCRNLYHLDISSNALQSLPENIGNLLNLQELDCGNNQLQSVPNWIENLINLRKLYFWANKLQSLPDCIGNLTNLQQLNCGSNQLQSLPKSLCNLVKLQRLSFYLNTLQILPENIGNLVRLQQLDCGNNQLQTLPESISNLLNLQQFDCSGNQLQTLPESIGNLSSLQQFDCNDNQLKTLPESIGHLVNLKELKCYFNKLQTLPESIGNLIYLQQLLFGSNQVQDIPENIGNLINLQELSCHFNNLQIFPNSIGNLVKLRQLECQNNQLQKLPLRFSDLKDNLQSLNYSENPFTEMPEIKEMGLGRLMDYLDEKRGKKPYKIVWKMSKELHKTLQKYLVGFQDFVFTLSGKEIKLEVHRQTEGLELVIEPRELSMAEIDDYLALYVGDKLEIDFEELKSKFSLTELFEAKRFLEEHKREKENLLYELGYLKDKCELIEGRNKELWITITFFQNQSEQHLEIILNQQKQLEIKQTTVNQALLLPADYQPNGVRTVKMFLASSFELKDEREAIHKLFSEENNKVMAKGQGIYIHIVQWEGLPEQISQDRKQGDYNEELKNCEVFLSLFWTKVGKYTEEEFDLAYSEFKAGKQPYILYTYFKTLTDDKKLGTPKGDLLSLWKFEEKLLKEINHFQSNFTNIDNLLRQLTNQLGNLPKLLKPKV